MKYMIVNYFYHEQIKKSTRKGAMRPGDACFAPTGAERRAMRPGDACFAPTGAERRAMRPGDACFAPTGAQRKGDNHAGTAGS